MNNSSWLRVASPWQRSARRRGRTVAALGCLLSVWACGAEEKQQRASAGSDVEAEFAHGADFESILAEAGGDLIVDNLPGQIGAHTLEVERGTRYLRDGEVIAKVQVTATEVRVATYVRGGGPRKHGLSISTSCEVVGQFYTQPVLEAGDVTITRCTDEYPLVRAMVSLLDLDALSKPDEPTQPDTEADSDTSGEPHVGEPQAPAPTSFEDVLEAAGDNIIVSREPGGGGANTGTLERGTVYLRDGDVAARVAVSALGVTVDTYVRGGGEKRHHVLISSACELLPHYYKQETFSRHGTLVASCPADYPLELASVGLVELSDTSVTTTPEEMPEVRGLPD